VRDPGQRSEYDADFKAKDDVENYGQSRRHSKIPWKQKYHKAESFSALWPQNGADFLI
jgi:hypothetical protein